MIEFDAIIRDYVIVELSPRHKQVYGYVYADEKGRFNDGDMIRTSNIIELNEERGYVKTRNSVYILDGKLNDSNDTDTANSTDD